MSAIGMRDYAQERQRLGDLRRGIVGVQHAIARHEMLQSGGILVGAAEGFSGADGSYVWPNAWFYRDRPSAKIKS